MLESDERWRNTGCCGVEATTEAEPEDDAYWYPLAITSCEDGYEYT